VIFFRFYNKFYEDTQMTISQKLFISLSVIATIASSNHLYAMDPAPQDTSIKQMADECSICYVKHYSNHPNVKPVLTSCCNQNLCLKCVNQIFGEGFQYIDNWGIASEVKYECPFCRKNIEPQGFQKILLDAEQNWEKEQQILIQHKALKQACIDGDVHQTKSILQTADHPYEVISKQSGPSWTLLHNSVPVKGNVEIVTILLEIAEKSNRLKDFLAIKDNLGNTALAVAKFFNQSEPERHLSAVIELLESYEMKIQKQQ
jgi:hypothetical protein